MPPRMWLLWIGLALVWLGLVLWLGADCSSQHPC